jgi:hypothetical protein
MSQELIEVDRPIAAVLQSEQSLPWVFQLLGEIDAEQFLVAFDPLRAVEAVPDVVQMPVYVVQAAIRKMTGWLVRKPYVAELEALAGEFESISHPPLLAVPSVMVTHYENLTSIQAVENLLYALLITVTTSPQWITRSSGWTVWFQFLIVFAV